MEEISFVKVAALGATVLALIVGAGCGCCAAGLFVFVPIFAAQLFIIADFFRQRDSSFPFLTTIRQYIKWRRQFIRGYFLHRKMQTETRDIRQQQETELMKILKYNADTEYARKWFKKDSQIGNRDDFVRLHPLVKYSHFESYYERMINGAQENVMTAESPVYYAETTGTTGKPSRIPQVPFQGQANRDYWDIMAYASEFVPGFGSIKKRMKLYYNVRRLLERSANGTQIGPASASPVTMAFGDMLTTPLIGYDNPNEDATRYVHLVFGLRERNLQKIEALFISLAYYAFVEMEKEWKNLVSDVRHGTLKADLGLEPRIRAQLEKELTPDPQRADELEREFNKGFNNIATRIWPNLKVIDCIAGGPFIHYVYTLRHQYIGSEIAIYSPLYAGTEGLFGMNLWPDRVPMNYLLFPYGIFYEFIPLANVHDTVPATLFMDQLEKGQDYEIVLTTRAGLYRYRLGDIVRVVDFFQQCPVIEFQYRSGQLLNIKAEKVSEVVMLDAIKQAVDSLDVKVERIVDFTACESLTRDAAELGKDVSISSVPCYVVFLELTITGAVNLKEVQLALADKVDERLAHNHSDYKLYRSKGAIGPLELYLLKPASFVRMRNYMLDNSGSSPSQLKMPRVLRKPELVKFIWGERV